MTPLVAAILGLGGALVLFRRPQTAGSGEGVPYLAPPNPPAGPPAGGFNKPPGPAGGAPTQGEIEEAYHDALLHETSAADLRTFGSALVIVGYSKEGASLMAKASHLDSTVAKVAKASPSKPLTKQTAKAVASIFGAASNSGSLQASATQAALAKAKAAADKAKGLGAPKPKTEAKRA